MYIPYGLAKRMHYVNFFTLDDFHSDPIPNYASSTMCFSHYEYLYSLYLYFSIIFLPISAGIYLSIYLSEDLMVI